MPEPPAPLDPAARKALRAEARSLRPSVRIGRAGATDAAVGEVARALAREPLVKVAISGDRDARDAVADALVRALGATAIAQVGSSLVLYRA